MEGKSDVIPTDPDVLTSEEKKQALEVINLIKEKYNKKSRAEHAIMVRNSVNM